MSKSLGNVVDPVEVISEYGTDALRFTLATGRPYALRISEWSSHPDSHAPRDSELWFDVFRFNDKLVIN